MSPLGNRVTLSPSLGLLGAAGLSGGLAALLCQQFGWKVGLAGAVLPATVLATVAAAPRLSQRAACRRRAFGFPEWGLLLLLVSVSLPWFFRDTATRTVNEVVSNPVNAVNLARTVLVGLVGVGAAVAALSLRDGEARRALAPGPLLGMLVYGAICLASVVYSSLPLATASKSLEIIVDVLFFMTLAAGAADRIPRLWNLTVGFLGLMLMGVWGSALFEPESGFVRLPGALLVQLWGVFPSIHPNAIGQMGALLTVVATNRVLSAPKRAEPGRHAWWLTVLVFGLVSLLVSQARTSLVALAPALGVCFFLHRRIGPLLLGLIGGVFILSAGSYAALREYILRGQTSDLFWSLTGRMSYWTEAWHFWLEAPWLGHGFYAGHRLDLNDLYARLDLSTLDNSYLQILVGVGMVGLTPVLLSLGSLTRSLAFGRALSRDGGGLRVEFLAAWVLIFCRSLTGPTIETHGMNLLLLLPAMAFAQTALRTQRRPAMRRCSPRPTSGAVRQRLAVTPAG